MNTQINDMEYDAKALGRKLVLLLKSSDLPEDVQLSIIELLPEMTLEQIDELVEVLTDNVARGGEINKKLEEKLYDVKEKYNSKKENLQSSIMSDLDDIEKEIQ